MQKNILGVVVLAVAVLMPLSVSAQTFWQDSGVNIYNSNNGNVGIGTVTPSQKLHMSGNVGSNNPVRIRIDNTNTSGFADVFMFNSAGKYNGFQIGGPSVAGTFLGITQANMGKFASSGDVLAIGTTVASPLILGTSDVERMRIGASGNVGIGTTTPSAKLEVKGNIKLSGNIVSDGDICLGVCQ